MLEWIQIMVLAIGQGLTEFLPVSSSGHLVLLQKWLGAHEGDLLLDVVLHGGTLGSVLVAYRREIARLLRFDRAALRYLLAIAVGTVPAVLVGAFLRPQVAQLFSSPRSAAVGLLVTAAFLATTRLTDREPPPPADQPWQPRPVPLGKALLIGGAQALAVAPGISRSGATIAASLWLALPRAEAARFSFLLAVPVIAGAVVLELASGQEMAWSGAVRLAVAALVACGVGLLAIRWTALAVVQRHFWKFSFYCLGLGIFALFVLR